MNVEALNKLSEKLGDVAKNAHFAMAYSLTKTVQLCKVAVQEKIRQTFKLRNKWTEQSVRVTTANYKDDSPFAEIFVKDHYLAEQETGATRKLEGDQAIPLPFLYSQTRAVESKPIPKAARAFSPAKGTRFPLGPIRKSKNGGVFIFVKAVPVYKLQNTSVGDAESYKIEPKPFFADTVQNTFNGNLEAEYDKAFQKYVLDELGK